VNICTIIAKNYLAHARVLARSFSQHHPDGRVWVLVIDDYPGYIDPAQQPFELLTPSDVHCDEFTQMAVRYSVLELSTAVKPWLLRHLIAETGEPITYLDPDIKIYGSVRGLDDLARDHGVALIPHNEEPIPDDGRRPSQVDIMISGVYNLGYVTVAPRHETDRLLDWWSERLTRDCRVDPVWGYFVDQRWFDLAPGLLNDLAIVRDPQYNVAYWNLHSRHVQRSDGQYLVNGKPLVFFHFSGFDSRHPLALSRYQDRIDVVGDPGLEQILAEYAADLTAEGHATSREWPYGFAALGDGTQLDETVRALFDDFASERNGSVASPFTLAGAVEFREWLQTPPFETSLGIDRVVLQVYRDRPDLQSAFPDLEGGDAPRLLQWVDEHGRREVPALGQMNGREGAVAAHATGSTGAAAMAPLSAPRSSETEPLELDRWGVNVVGQFRSDRAIGEAARQIVRALDQQGVPLLPVLGQALPFSRQRQAFATAEPEEAPFAVNLICLDGDRLSEFAVRAGRQFFGGRHSVGLWFWPLSDLPDSWRSSLSLLDEVWAPTEHVADAIASSGGVPVCTVPIPVDPFPPSARSGAELGLVDGCFHFLFSFDYLGSFQRKNPLAAIEAFSRAFRPGEGARLVLKCVNAERDPQAHARLVAAAQGNADVELIDRYLPPADHSALISACDCYLSLHRAEAFGTVLAHAMWFGRPVIATGYSGNLDFMSSANSHLVDHRLIAVGEGAGPYSPDSVWAEPDIEHAVALMQKVFADRDSARELGVAAARDIRETHSATAAGESLFRRLESVRGAGRARPAIRSTPYRSPALAKLPLHIRQGPGRLAPRRPGRARELLRTAALRGMRPFAVYQRAIDEQIVAALEDVGVEAHQLRLHDAVARAALMSELRRFEPVASAAADHEERLRDVEEALEQEGSRALDLAIAEIRRRHELIVSGPAPDQEFTPLRAAELRAFSRHGEDGVLAELLRRIGAPTKFFVALGGEPGIVGNGVALADVAGWKGAFLPEREIDPENVTKLLADAGVPSEFDVLSVELGPAGHLIWEALEAFSPRIVLDHYDDELRRLAQRKAYRLVHVERSGATAFLVRGDVAGAAHLSREIDPR
jgi:glycosyltransferase involved in cell wall biosynthesis